MINMARQIMTAKGLISSDALGLTSMHEHIMRDGAVQARRLHAEIKSHNFPIRFEDKISLENVGILHRNAFLALDALMLDDEHIMLQETELFQRAGGNTLVDVTATGSRLDTAAIGRIAAASEINIILSAGFDASYLWPRELRGLNVGDYRNYLLEEIKYGVDHTGILPGHLIIHAENLNQDEEYALRAAAQVCYETNMALTVHPPEGVVGGQMLIIDILKEEGVNMERVIMSHTPLTDKPPFARVIRHPHEYRVNTDLAKRILDSGCNIAKEFSNTMGWELGGDYDEGDWGDMAGFVSLINEGYCRQMVTGSDVSGNIALHNKGGEGFCRMLYYTLPMLRDMAGISDYALRRIFYENPKRILSY
jgi:phosphotriesterase-related protein